MIGQIVMSRERSRAPDRHQRRGHSREHSLWFRHGTPEREVKNHVHTIHRDDFDLKLKPKSPERRNNSPQLKHEVIYVIVRGFVGGGPSNNA